MIKVKDFLRKLFRQIRREAPVGLRRVLYGHGLPNWFDKNKKDDKKNKEEK